MDYQQKQDIKQKATIAGAGVVVGAVAWWIVLANVFGWMSPTTAAQQTSDAVEAKLDEALAPLCADRFMENKAALAKFAAAGADYDRNEIVQKAVPKLGSTTVDYQLADHCTDVIATRLKTASPSLAQDAGKKS
ncbi:MAG: hypothetical protein IRY89_15440 [Pseudolabrys sp.]|nr:hypothetical protein [Pseudolabrys sp.]